MLIKKTYEDLINDVVRCENEVQAHDDPRVRTFWLNAAGEFMKRAKNMRVREAIDRAGLCR